MPMLAELVDGVIGVDTHRDTLAAAAVSNLGGVLAQTHHQRRRRRLPAAAGLRPDAAAWPSLLGGRGSGQLRRRPDGLPAAARRAGRRGRPTQAASPPQRRQERRAGRGPGRPRGAWPRSAGDPAASRAAGGAAGAADHPALRHPGPGGRHRPAQGAAGGRSRGAAGRAARPPHQPPDRLLRRACGRGRPGRWSTRPPCGRCGPPPSASSSCRPRPTSSRPSWPCWSVRSRPGCWRSPASGPSAPPRCWSAGRMPAGSAPRPPLPPWPAPTRSPPPPGR